MKLYELLDLSKNIFRQARTLQKGKNHDYSDDDDALSNFKKQAIICEALGLDNTPKAMVMQLHVLKLIRITNLWSKKNANYESIEDSNIDGINYQILSEACRIDEQEE